MVFRGRMLIREVLELKEETVAEAGVPLATTVEQEALAAALEERAVPVAWEERAVVEASEELAAYLKVEQSTTWAR